MILEFLAAIVIGFSAWGILMMAFRLFSRKPPKFMIPLVVGLGILAFNIYSEYNWVERAKGGLPEGLVVVKEITTKSLLRPWTMIFPKVDKLVIVDTKMVNRNPKLPNFVMTETAVMSRYQETMTALHMVDCVNRRRADILITTTMGEDGLPTNVQWRNLGPNDRLLNAVCG